MAEKIVRHAFTPDKSNKNKCADCPYMAANPIHFRDQGSPTMIRGQAHPNKLG